MYMANPLCIVSRHPLAVCPNTVLFPASPTCTAISTGLHLPATHGTGVHWHTITSLCIVPLEFNKSFAYYYC
jgi:hypothetical protein